MSSGLKDPDPGDILSSISLAKKEYVNEGNHNENKISSEVSNTCGTQTIGLGIVVSDVKK